MFLLSWSVASHYSIYQKLAVELQTIHRFSLVGAFNQEKALVGAFSVIVKIGCGTDGALHSTSLLPTCDTHRVGVGEDGLLGLLQHAAGVPTLLRMRSYHHHIHLALTCVVPQPDTCAVAPA